MIDSSQSQSVLDATEEQRKALKINTETETTHVHKISVVSRRLATLTNNKHVVALSTRYRAISSAKLILLNFSLLLYENNRLSVTDKASFLYFIYRPCLKRPLLTLTPLPSTTDTADISSRRNTLIDPTENSKPVSPLSTQAYPCMLVYTKRDPPVLGIQQSVLSPRKVFRFSKPKPCTLST